MDESPWSFVVHRYDTVSSFLSHVEGNVTIPPVSLSDPQFRSMFRSPTVRVGPCVCKNRGYNLDFHFSCIRLPFPRSLPPVIISPSGTIWK